MQDYPSVGHINTLLKQFNIIPIFAVEAATQPLYEAGELIKKL